MKKRRILVCLLIFVFCLSGCTSAISLTDHEENVIAEYLAGALLRSDDNYKEELIEPTPTPSLSPTVMPTPSLTATVTPDESNNATGSQNASELNEYANADFAQVIGMDGITTEYIKYDIISSISDGNFNVDLKTQNMFVVSFEITNQTSEDIKFQLGQLNIAYQLNLDAKKNIKPLITIFEDDLRFIDTVVKANDSITAKVVFGVDKDLKFDTASLIISREDKTAIIKLD